MSHDYAAAPMSPEMSEISTPPHSPPQQQMPYRVSRPMSPALSRSSSGFFSVNSGASTPNANSRPGFYRSGTSTTRSGSFILNTSAYTRPFKTRRIEPGTSEKPWLEQKRTRTTKAISAIPLVGLLLGLVIVAIYAYTGYTSFDTVPMCEYWEDDFSAGLDTSIWTREVQLDGFGTSEFEWTTPYENNSYVKDGQLYIEPTLSWVDESDGNVLNLTTMGICTSTSDSACAATANSTAGTYIPPIASARLNTKMSKFITYGRVEVTAKLPVGDWLWPAIWMMPVESKYGIWPRSGEIDIVESRGNGHDYVTVINGRSEPGGNNALGSTLHWGPESWADAYSYTTNGYHYPSSINDLTQGFHTYGMEWTPNGIRMYVDKVLTQVDYFKFPKNGFWALGEFASNMINPWFGGSKATPFDQDFYLILNVAVGGTNGYFADGQGIKPWTNGLTRDQAMKQFHDSQESWLPTWTQPHMVVDKVKMWKPCSMMT